VLGLHGKVFVVRRAAGAASVRRQQELSLCQTDPVLTAFKRDLLLGKDQTFNDIGSSSVITYLRKDKNSCAAAMRDKSKI